MPVAVVTYDFLSPGRMIAKGATARVHAAQPSRLIVFTHPVFDAAPERH